MIFRLRPIVVILVALSMLLGTLGQVTGSFDDADPNNDPNFCASAEAPENCDWTRGWFQAAVNVGHITLEAARTRFPDLNPTDWLPEEVRIEREAELTSAIQLLEDDDPTNDPNPCFESADPNCDWTRGWYASLFNIANSILNADDSSTSPALKESFQSFMDAYRLAEITNPIPDPDDGSTFIAEYRWFCGPGVPEAECSIQPANQCGPGEDPRNGGCWFHP